jgi:thiosulfate/3-mercaptopyruvate sulfurtransferase
MNPLPIADRGYANPELLADTKWLAQRISDENVRVIDARAPKDYAESHLPGAVSLSGFGGIPRDSSGDMAEPGKFEAVARALGINNDTIVVVYDAPSQMMGTIAWGFLYYGHQRVHLLDGGLAKWTLEGNPTSQVIAEYPYGNFTANPDNTVYCSLPEAKQAVSDSHSIFWDTRSLPEYEGATSVIDVPLLRQGHIPGAVHLEWKELFDEEHKTLKAADDLRELLEARGITPEYEVNTY